MYSYYALRGVILTAIFIVLDLIVLTIVALWIASKV